MTRTNPTRPHEPHGFAWCLGLAGLMLPWIAVPLALAGLIIGVRGEPFGWLVLAAGIALLILDIVIDVAWARMAAGRSDEPDLNRRGAAIIGRIVTVAEPIEAGRGKVMVGDSVWIAEGPDMPKDSRATVTAVDGVVLKVEPRCGKGPTD